MKMESLTRLPHQLFPSCWSNSNSKSVRVRPFSCGQLRASDPISSLSRKTTTGRWSWTMTRSSTGVSVFRGRDGGRDDEAARVFEQEAFLAASRAEGLEPILNGLSKWIISGVLGAIVVCRHDAAAMWFAGGTVVNNLVSIILKQILNQQRPITDLRSDPGMPSSHAQSIFFISTFALISILELVGINGYTIFASGLTLAFASYFSWLRVLQQLHTVSQITVGGVLGTIMCILWYWTWHAMAMQAFQSLLWVRLLVILGAAAACFSFTVHLLRYWFRAD